MKTQSSKTQPDSSGNPTEFTYPRLVQEPYQPARLHLFWGGSWYARSTDAGATWTPPVNLMLQYSAWALTPAPQVTADYTGGFHWAQSGFWNGSDYDDHDVLYRRFVHQAAPAGTLNFAAHFAQQGAGYVRFDNLQIPGVAALDLTSALSVECWVKLDPATLNADLVARDLPGLTGFLPIWRLAAVEDGSGNRWFQAAVSAGVDSALAQDNQRHIQPGVWYHLAMTFDAAPQAENLKLYLNGDLLGTATCTTPLPHSTLPILVSRFFDGAVDDLRFWNRALTAQEVRDRFTGPLVGDEPGLAAYYKFDGSWTESAGNGLPAVPMYRESFGAGADVEPLLKIEALPGGQVRLSWLTFGANYTLKSAAALATPDWQPVPGTPAQVNGRWTVTLTASDTARFFRLERN